ncbi:Tripartite motif-containing protein 26 [Saguinus oedipus]|uniref:Tripartite motif-containing protein 26 n=1 Tax=Saguinus oedipus TaxID=9490 RepID=A0ABQ9VVB1_SAGOE|nr:Tripartite motif-containing protein 26 [Saguinus oedipus]
MHLQCWALHPEQRCQPFSPSCPLQKKLQDQRQYIVAEFEQGHQFLREREQHLLEQLAKLEQELTEGREKFKSRGVGELARLALVISELEGKAQQPAAELMQRSGPQSRAPALSDSEHSDCSSPWGGVRSMEGRENGVCLKLLTILPKLSEAFISSQNMYPRKKFWVGKPIARVVKKKTGEFSDKLLSLQRGLREFQGKLLRDLEYKTVAK